MYVTRLNWTTSINFWHIGNQTDLWSLVVKIQYTSPAGNAVFAPADNPAVQLTGDCGVTLAGASVVTSAG